MSAWKLTSQFVILECTMYTEVFMGSSEVRWVVFTATTLDWSQKETCDTCFFLLKKNCTWWVEVKLWVWELLKDPWNLWFNVTIARFSCAMLSPGISVNRLNVWGLTGIRIKMVLLSKCSLIIFFSISALGYRTISKLWVNAVVQYVTLLWMAITWLEVAGSLSFCHSFI